MQDTPGHQWGQPLAEQRSLRANEHIVKAKREGLFPNVRY